MLITKQKIVILISIIFLSFSLPFFVGARGLVPCGGYADDTSQTREPPCTVDMIFVLVARVTNWLLSLVGLFAIYNIISAGFYLAISDGDEEKITSKKKALTSAVVGFVLALMAFLFVNTIVNYLLARQTPGCTINLSHPTDYLNLKGPNCIQNK